MFPVMPACTGSLGSVSPRRHVATAAICLLLNASMCIGDERSAMRDANRLIDRGEYESAVRLMIPLAEGGNAEAQLRIGMILENGLGMPADPELAREWIERYCPTPLTNAFGEPIDASSASE